MASTNYVIIVAGGSGSRMGSEIPKQFLVLGDKPILMHTIEKFYQFDQQINCIVVLPKHQIDYWKELCKKYVFKIQHTIVEGGNSRFQSVKNGLASIRSTNGIVAIHDGVRPMITSQIIGKSFDMALKEGNAIVSVKLKDSIRITLDNGLTQAKEREKYYLIQTPQTFQLELIQKAFQTEESPEFTDDATVAEKNGVVIKLIGGSYSNIKITTPEDLIFANALISANPGL